MELIPPWFWNALLGLPALMVGVGFHEYAHAWVAHRLGDETPESQGRLSINPLAHLDPLGTLLFFLVGFGWGRPVEILPSRFRDPRRGHFLVAIAGVTANLLLAALSAVALWAVIEGGLSHFDLTLATWDRAPAGLQNLVNVLQGMLRLNLLLVAFNLLPCPPLDGGQVFRYLLGRRGDRWMQSIERHGSAVLLVLVLSGAIGIILHPTVILFGILMHGAWVPWAQLGFLLLAVLLAALFLRAVLREARPT